MKFPSYFNQVLIRVDELSNCRPARGQILWRQRFQHGEQCHGDERSAHGRRGFPSGILETKQDLGQATGATIFTIIMAVVLPGGIALMVATESQRLYMQVFQTAALEVVRIMISGVVIAAFYRFFGQASPADADD